jgi:hypothetical protein
VSVRQLYDGSDRPDSDSLQRRRSRGRSSDSVSTPSAAPVAEPSVAPRRLQSLLIWGGRALDVHAPLIAGGGHGPTPAVAEAGGIVPRVNGEECCHRRGGRPKRRNARALKQGMSDRPVKKARVRSKM